jgi:hypothetical protein
VAGRDVHRAVCEGEHNSPRTEHITHHQLTEEPGDVDDTERSQIGKEVAIELTDDSSVPSHFVATCCPGSEFVEGWLEFFVGVRILCCESSANAWQ